MLTCLTMLPFVSGAQNKSLEQAMRRAAEKKQLVMIDFYTDWCGWCKVLEKETFPDPMFQSALKDRFILVRLNAEKEEGNKLAMRYGIRGYPTCVFMTATQKVVQINFGYMKASSYAAALDSIWKNHQTGQYLAFGDSGYPDFPEFYRNMFQTDKNKRKWPTSEEKEKYMADPANWNTEAGAITINAVYHNSLKYLKPLAMKYESWNRMYSSGIASQAFQYLMSVYIDSNFHRPASEMKDSLSMYAKLAGAGNTVQTDWLYHSFLESYYEKSGQWSEYAALTDMQIKTATTPWSNESINLSAWQIYENTRDTSALKLALGWMKKVVNTDEVYNHADTYAALLFALGRLDEAEEAARYALELAAKSREDVAGTEKLIRQINSAR